MNFVVTGFNELYWNKWGSSWILSLRRYYQGHVLIVDCGLSNQTKTKLKDKNVLIIENIFSLKDIRTSTIKTLANYAKTNEGKYAYWDADVFFQEDIVEIFSIISDNFVISKNHNSGFIAAKSSLWERLVDINNFVNLACKEQDFNETFLSLVKNFNKSIDEIEDTWNYTDISEISIQEDKVKIKDEIKKVIHPSGNIKYALENKNFLFHERNKEEYENLIENKPISKKIVFKKLGSK